MTASTLLRTAVAALMGSTLLAAPALAHPPTAAAPAAGAPYYEFQRVVYQNSAGWPDEKTYFQRLLRNIGAHLAATEGKVEIRVVSFAAGVKLFQLAKIDPAVAKALDDLRAKNVRFLICRNTLAAMNLTRAELYKVEETDIVASGAAEIARLQGLGYVYVHP